jgi:hypothetical protein
MSKYLPSVEFSTEYEGDKVKMVMRPLDRPSAMKIAPYSRSDDEDKNRTQEEKIKVYDVACEILSEHLEEVSGLRDSNGNAVSKDAMLEHIYFMDLVMPAFARLVEASQLGKEQKPDSEEK